MKKIMIPALGMLIAASSALASVTITNPATPGAVYTVEQSPLSGAESVSTTITLDSKGSATFIQENIPLEIRFTNGDGQKVAAVFSANSAEDIFINFNEKNQPVYSGTPLMNDIQLLLTTLSPIEEEAAGLAELYQQSPAAAQSLYTQLQSRYTEALKSFLTTHADSPAAPYALLAFDGKDMLDAYALLSPIAKSSILMPLTEKALDRARRSVAAEELQSLLDSGSTQAPTFTLPDLNGKPVSLADFKGKWVILDFWGSWCRWCIKGFPELKEIYTKYPGKLEIIGIDCNEPMDKWKEGVAKYELPWVNLYLDTEKDTSLLQAYAVQGFPTKVIVNPEGIIKKVVVGADPEFPAILDSLISGK